MTDLTGYQILSPIYESANSLVYRGIRERDNQPIILKVLKQDYPNPSELTRYKQEYEITRSLAGKGVVQVYDLHRYQNSLVMTLEDFGGKSLKGWMTERQFPLGEFLTLAIAIAESLGKIHAANVIHKDINPSNIVYNPETGEVKIIDFGISSVLSRENPTILNPDRLEGTLAYISPEQTGRMNRAIDYRTDFYSLGVTFYELLTHQLPFTATEPLELVHSHIARQPVPPAQIDPKIPQVVSDLVMKLMAKTAEERYQSARGLKLDLETCLHQLQTNGEISAFPLATQDQSDKFQIPQKLYGREQEVQQLLNSWDSLGQGTPVLILVAGYSGVGKSALVNEVQKPLVKSRGYFISGKFDQFKRNIPYSSLIQAFQELIRQLLTESEGQLEIWKQKLLNALGNNSQVIIEVMPELELIIGKQPPVPQLGPTEAQNRFNLVFQQFVSVFAQAEHPVVMFIDDLQWADSASLKLLEQLLSDADNQYLLTIGAYRDNEVSPTHPFILTVERIQKAGTQVDAIQLQALLIEQVSQLIGDTLNVSTAESEALTELVFSKTGGNPFFLTQLLEYLYQEKFLSFNYNSGNWEWNMDSIQQVGITDNVVELMVNKIGKLHASSQNVLKLAACIGNRFDLETLSVVNAKSISATANDLLSALQEGLIVPLTDAYKTPMLWDREALMLESPDSSVELFASYPAYIPYKFLHDRVQQAAYSLIPEAQKKEFHLNIGRLFLQNTPSDSLEENIFDIVNQLNKGAELIATDSEKNQLARLNLKAGKKAKDSTAYEPALQYLEAGLALLPPDSWQTEYEFTLALHVETVEVYYLNTRFEDAEQLGAVVLQEAQSLLERVKIYELKIQSQYAQFQLQSVIDTALEILEPLGVVLPRTPTPEQIEAEENLIKELLGDRKIEDLANLPEMTDPYQLAALRILLTVTSATIITDPLLCPLVTMVSVKFCIQNGNSPLAAGAYIFYAQLLCGVLKNIEWGHQFCQLSLMLKDKMELGNLKALVIHYSIGIRHWKESFRDIPLAQMQEGIQVGIETGNFENACYNALDYCCYSIFAGVNLLEFLPKHEQYTQLIIKLKQIYSVYWNRALQGIPLNLLKEDFEYYGLTVGKSWEEEEQILAEWVEMNATFLLCIAYLSKAFVFYYLNQFDSALEAAQKAELYGESSSSYVVFPQHRFYYSLALVSVCHSESIPTLKKAEFLEKARSNQELMKEWAKYAPENYQNKYDLVEAELARISGNYLDAQTLYEKAIQGARKQGFIHEEGLAYERAAEYYLTLDREEIGQFYLKNAYACYASWGATAKLKCLSETYPNLLVKVTQRRGETGTLPVTTTGRDGKGLDIETVVKASQAIASEIVLDQLLDKLMRLTIENAGAQKGFLILPVAGKLSIEATGIVNGSEAIAVQSVPIEESLELSSAIVHYVARTQSSVILNDASNAGTFTTDSYIVQNQPKSVLCAPILNQGQLTGIIYLENNLATGAFTQERIELLQVISAQAAISLENAQLYRTLEDKVIERTAQLAEANEEISALNELLKSDNLRMSAELDVTRQLQQKMLPRYEELQAIPGLEIAGFMEPADEIGGDYYDVLNHEGHIKIGIGDVTGHGLEAGMVMVMVQTAVRTLLVNDERDYVKFLNTINRMIHDNVARMRTDKNLTLALLDYADGVLRITGQHEEVLVVRGTGEIERLDTIDLGFPVGLELDISDFITQAEVELNPGDGVVLYTDGIPEAENMAGEFYGMDRLCAVVSQYWQESAEAIRSGVIQDVREFIGEQKVFDDITLVVMKQR
ncbi:AAA family ATPase [Laspinema olomoucense]|uniref:AAA family ATPase n=1 Tax=Laspinema olomoucense TaxID=3231600 RepID=UPI0021BA6166|nr:AAA family ATPase [Laspinema sp. D3c]MCT7993564.1 AAA family ATPase [Laspinema sp. D3c]